MSESIFRLSESTATPAAKAVIATAYGVVSLAIVFVNKYLFTSFEFTNYRFVAFCQCVTTVVVLYLQQWMQQQQQRRRQQASGVISSNAASSGNVAIKGSSWSPVPQSNIVEGGDHAAVARHAHARSHSGGGIPATVVVSTSNPPSAECMVAAAATASISSDGGGGKSSSILPLNQHESISIKGHDPAHQLLFARPSWQVLWRVMPLPLLFLANTVSGLGATQHLTMPMFVLLRRFSILMTMGFEYWLLQKRFSTVVQCSVLLMIVGAAVAALGDLRIDFNGYALIFVNNFFTALTSVVTRRVMDRNNAELGTHGVLFYNSLVAAPGALILVLLSADEVKSVLAYPHWRSPMFVMCFAASMLLGFVLNVVYFLCNKVNSPLTTAVVGSMKNVLSAYVGMFFVDYMFTWVNFLGVNISVVATLIYSREEVLKASAMAKGKGLQQPPPQQRRVAAPAVSCEGATMSVLLQPLSTIPESLTTAAAARDDIVVSSAAGGGEVVAQQHMVVQNAR